MKKGLDQKDLQILDMKLQGKNSKEIAAVIYPDSPNGDVAVRKRLQKATMQDAVNAELLDEGVTLKEILRPAIKALRSTTKTVRTHRTITGTGDSRIEEIDDEVFEEDNIPLQLQGHDRLVKLTGIDKMHDTEANTPPLDDEELKELAATSDEIELTKILFKKNKT